MNSDADNPPLGDSANSLAKVVESLARRFSSHPGFMWTGDSFAVLHADWPAYPKGVGYKTALAAMADAGKLFYPISNIGQCTLFLVDREPKPSENKFNCDYFHVAVWDDDLRELGKKGFLVGLLDVDGEPLQYAGTSIELTHKAYEALLIHDLTFDLAAPLLDRVEPFLYSGHFDTSIREASVLLEESLRRLIGAGRESYGIKLAEKCFHKDSKVVPSSVPNAERLELRNEFRLFFRHVRNRVAHEDLNLDVVTCARVLRRCSNLLQVVESLRHEGGA